METRKDTQMEKLFDALRQKQPGAVVRDVKFIVDPREVDGQDLGALDEALAEIVRKTKPLEGPHELT